MLYGGPIENCKLNGLDSSIRSGEVFDKILHIENDYHKTSRISSDPIHICLCKNNLPDCSGSWKYRYTDSGVPYLVYPGKTFQVYVVATGQRDQTVPSTVRSMVRTVKEPGQLAKSINSGPANLLDYQYLQQTNNPCTKLNYTVFSLSQKVIIKLHPEVSTSCSKHTGGALYFSLTIKHMDLTFLSQQNYVSVSQDLPNILIDYCVNDPKVFSLKNTDVHCKYNRSGFLCGYCKDGYSLVLGTHRCRKWTNIYLLLLFPFALMGVALVFLRLVCKLTVA